MKLHWIKNKGFQIQAVTGKKKKVDILSLPLEFQKVSEMKNGFNFVTKDFIADEGLAMKSIADICSMSNAVFKELLSEVREYIGFLYKLNDTLGLLDLVTSFATVSMSMDYIRPNFGERILIKAGRHPILERSVTELTPNDCNMSDESRIHILTGANMSGKSTYLRQLVLITVMAQLGCFVPAETATIKIFDRIFSRVSNRDSVESNASTFMLEMQEIAFILTNVTESSLVVLDELGRGTSVREGTAVCWAVSEELLGVGCLVFLATHFSNMNLMSDLHPFVQSYHFQLSEAEDKQVTTHHLVKGGVNLARTMYGIETASQSKFKFPQEMIERAKDFYKILTLSNSERRISKIDVINAEHIFMLKQLVVQGITGEELKEAVSNIRASFVSVSENLSEVDDADSRDVGSDIDSFSRSGVETVRSGQEREQQGTDRVSPLMSEPGKGLFDDPELEEDNNKPERSPPSCLSQESVMPPPTVLSGKGLFDDPALEEDSRPPLADLSQECEKPPPTVLSHESRRPSQTGLSLPQADLSVESEMTPQQSLVTPLGRPLPPTPYSGIGLDEETPVSAICIQTSDSKVDTEPSIRPQTDSTTLDIVF